MSDQKRRPIHTYCIRVDGYCDALVISSCWRVADPPGIGKRILVAGLPATRVIGRGDHYVWFMRDDSDAVLCSHPADVSEAA